MPSSARYPSTCCAAASGNPACSCSRLVAIHLPLMTEEHHGAGREIDQPVALHGLLVDFQRRPRGIERDLPAAVIQLVRYPEGHGLVMRIEKQQKIRVLGAL